MSQGLPPEILFEEEKLKIAEAKSMFMLRSDDKVLKHTGDKMRTTFAKNVTKLIMVMALNVFEDPQSSVIYDLAAQISASERENKIKLVFQKLAVQFVECSGSFSDGSFVQFVEEVIKIQLACCLCESISIATIIAKNFQLGYPLSTIIQAPSFLCSRPSESL